MTTDAPSPPPAGTRPPRSWKRILVTVLLTLAIAPAALVSALGFFGRFDWTLDLLSHFRAQYTLWFAVWAVVAIIARRRDLAILASLATVLNLVPLSYYLPLPSPPPRSAQHNLRIITFNIFGENTEEDAVLTWLRKQDADLIILPELSPRWVKALRPLMEDLPHTYLHPGYANYGLAIYSRHPLSHKKTERLCDARVPCLTATATVHGVPLHLFAVHPVSPVTEEEFALRNEHLANLATLVQASPAPLLVAGDFNVTPFSPFFSSFRKSTGLLDAAQGRGFHPTYDQFHPLCGIPIDHILHSPHLTSVAFHVGPHLGSDHNPIIADFLLTPAPGHPAQP